ncbi:hypothetical protein PNO31109_00589 [Pandoraea nosoerga]|uniref:Uncharacterized protein n=2 Tax=Pandoraea nosoerga TaxID=2508296 RepID=A0A5E4S564_9BURK|nr:hypothetical protein PNO31109_00589 [Pandoraea nosoerga]
MRAPVGRGRGGMWMAWPVWRAWLVAALLCVQVWGLQHEILHARSLSQAATAADVSGESGSYVAGTDTADDTGAAPHAARAARATRATRAVTASLAGAHVAPLDFGGHHHHCHLFEGATLAATMATAAWHWGGEARVDDTPPRATGRVHASAPRLPFESRAPPVPA